MKLDCKTYCQHWGVCNRAKPERRGEAALQYIRIPSIHGKLWELTTSLTFLKIALMVKQPFLLLFVT